MKSRESPIKWGPDVLKVPSWATPAGPIWKLHKKCVFAFPYLKVSSVVVVEGLEKLIWVGDVRNQLEFPLQIPEKCML